MLSRDQTAVLAGLEKIEAGLSRIYKHLSEMRHFAGPVKAFWSSISAEEMMHAGTIAEIREKAMADEAFRLELRIDIQQLQGFVQKVNAFVERVNKEEISESEAYTLAALIEAELHEAAFLDALQIDHPGLAQKIRRLANDTKRHRMILVNYTRGVK
jgi:rubrerythrin